MNTCYDLYFDRNTRDLVYGLWSNRHDAPYYPNLSDKDWTKGAFAISRGGGNTWDFSYSTGLPEDCIPVKMSVMENSSELTIAVATFNRGFFISYDSGKTFASINNGMETVQGLIWGEDVVLTENCAYCLTAPYNCVTGSWEPSELYSYDLNTGTVSTADIGELVLVRSLTYNPTAGLYLNVMPTYHYEWFSNLNGGLWVNDHGGIYHYDGTTVNCVFANTDGIFNSAFSPEGTMYAIDPYGKVFAGKDGEFTLFADGMFIMLKNVSFNSVGNIMYVTTFGGGTYRIAIPAPDPGEDPSVCEHTPEIRNAREATCTTDGYTGDIYCADCGILISKGEVIPMTGHTLTWVSNGDATHSQRCSVCNTVLTTGTCQDADGDGLCDVCGYCSTVQHQIFQKVSVPDAGKSFLIVIKGKALQTDLVGCPIQMMALDGLYKLDCSIDDGMLWNYDSGRVYSCVDGVNHYLSVSSSEILTTTTDSSQASQWSVSSGSLTTKVTRKKGKKTSTATYYLTVSGSSFTLSTKKVFGSLYELQS